MVASALWLADAETAERVRCVMSPCRVSGQVVYSAEVEEKAEIYWQQRLASNGELFDGPVWVVMHWEFDRKALELILHTQLTSYKYVLFNYFSGYVQLSAGSKASALGASAITRTSDGFIVLGLRSGKVATTPHTWHFAPAGNVDRTDLDDLMASELKEELGLTCWQEFRVFGLFDTGKEQGHKTEIVFFIQLNETLAQVRDAFALLNDHEHDAIDGFNTFPDTLSLTEIADAALRCYFERH